MRNLVVGIILGIIVLLGFRFIGIIDTNGLITLLVGSVVLGVALWTGYQNEKTLKEMKRQTGSLNKPYIYAMGFSRDEAVEDLEALKGVKKKTFSFRSPRMYSGDSAQKIYPVILVLKNSKWATALSVAVEHFGDFHKLDDESEGSFSLEPGEKALLVCNMALNTRDGELIMEDIYNKGFKEGIHDLSIRFQSVGGERYRLLCTLLISEVRRSEGVGTSKHRVDVLSQSIETIA